MKEECTRKSNCELPALNQIDKSKPIHFVGIGGAGMSAIAKVLIEMGFKVEGSDLKESNYIRLLRNAGASIAIGHREENISNPSLLVVSSAIPHDNPEVRLAKARGIPVISRALMLGTIVSTKVGIAVAGTHGKTTTASMIANIMIDCGVDPSFLIGGELNEIGGNARFGNGDFLVAEADESDGSLLLLKPFAVVLTNIDSDHMDYFGNIEKVEAIFSDFLHLIPSEGFAIVCGDDFRARSVAIRYSESGGNVFTYGKNGENDYYFKEVNLSPDGTTFSAFFKGKKIGNVRLSVCGMHNVYNALAALSTAHRFGFDIRNVIESLGKFSGVRRRFEFVGQAKDVCVFDDYAHHPTEIKAVIDTARLSSQGRLIVVFQPHRFTRTRLLAEQFGDCFDGADVLVLTEIYGAGEEPEPGVTSKLILDSIKKRNRTLPVHYIPNRSSLASKVVKLCSKGDTVITMGAGDITQCSREILDLLKDDLVV